MFSILTIKKEEYQKLISSLEQYKSDVKQATEFIKEIEKGNLNVSYHGILDEASEDKESLAGSLLSMRDQMKSYENQERERKWVNEGLAKFIEILRADNSDLKTLCEKITSNLVQYLNANQGYLFIVNDNDLQDVHLELMACYAYDRKKHIDKRVDIREGLLGQTFLEKETVILTNVPRNYVHITSGLGEATPGFVGIIPLKINDVVYGIFEIASLEKVEQYQIEFVEKLGESVASTISSAKINQKTQQLLAESREMTETMRSQEEEMRQNMEELQATQEEMEKKSNEIENKFNTLNDCNIAYIEFDLDGYISNANDAICQTFGYKLEEIIGKHHSTFVTTQYKNSLEYQQFWTDLRAGNLVKGDFERITKSGEKVYLRAAYSYLRDGAGVPFKIIKLATNVTESVNILQEYNSKKALYESQAAELLELKRLVADLEGKLAKNN